MSEYKNSIDIKIIREGEVVIKARGTSMLPFLRPQKDILYIKALKNDPKVNDVVLFHYNGKNVLHRVIRIESDQYIMRGDSCVSCECVRRECIIGILNTVVRNGRSIQVDSLACRVYSKIWQHTFLIRRVAIKMLVRCKHFIRKNGGRK